MSRLLQTGQMAKTQIAPADETSSASDQPESLKRKTPADETSSASASLKGETSC